MKTLLEAHQHIQEAAAESTEIRFVESMEIGDFARQGDIYLVRVKSAPTTAVTTNRQLAIGNTQGSRHMAAGEVDVHQPASSAIQTNNLGRYYLGPTVVARDYWTVEHPEHAHISLPAGIYEVRHQLDAASMNRVID
jgi:hypothetical protein